MWGNYIFVPRGNDLNQVGGFSLSEVVSHEFFPKGHKRSRDAEGREEALLRVNLKGREDTLIFHGLLAENLFSQMEDWISGKRIGTMMNEAERIERMRREGAASLPE